jgi:predicted nucleotidyltransferase component of viral defense system
VKNVAHSIAQRLLDVSKKSGDDYTLVSMRFATERLLYRIGQSAYSQKFILKGATLFLAWHGHSYRTTKDVDLLGFGKPDPERLIEIFKKLCLIDTSTIDGLVFLPKSLRARTIQNKQEYHGIRIDLRAMLGRARINLQIDVGYGDAVTPKPEKITFPTLLELPAPVIMAYPRYTALAEKFMALVVLGMENSRMKDFYDICVMFRTMEFNVKILAKTMRATFAARHNALPHEMPVALSDEFANDERKVTQWKAFANRSNLSIPVGQLSDVIREIRARLLPVLSRLGIATIPPKSGG